MLKLYEEAILMYDKAIKLAPNYYWSYNFYNLKG